MRVQVGSQRREQRVGEPAGVRRTQLWAQLSEQRRDVQAPRLVGAEPVPTAGCREIGGEQQPKVLLCQVHEFVEEGSEPLERRSAWTQRRGPAQERILKSPLLR